jgi:hypothetical protein
MKVRRRFALPLLALMIANAPTPAPTSGTLQDKRLREASGLAASKLVAGRYWAINDSGNPPLLFALDANGAALGRVRIANTLNRDWEAMGSGPCPQDIREDACLYIADTGDNDADRTDIRIEIIAEPRLLTATNATVARSLKVSFEDGPRDVETLLVHPQTGDLFLIEKLERQLLGNPAGLYHLVTEKDQNAATAKRIRSVPATASSGEAIGRITDGAFLPNGTQIVLRDLHHTYLAPWPSTQGALNLTSFASPEFPQAEALAVSSDGKSVLLTSEGRGSKISQVNLPE